MSNAKSRFAGLHASVALDTCAKTLASLAPRERRRVLIALWFLFIPEASKPLAKGGEDG